MAIIRANFGFYDSMIRGLVSTAFFIDASGPNNRIEIYAGPMPADADSFFSGYPGAGSPTSNLLATFSDFRITQNTVPSTGNNLDVQEAMFTGGFEPNPGTVTATGTGIAVWYAMYNTTRFATHGALLGDCSISGGTGSVHLDSLSIVAGSPVQLLHWGVRFQT